MKLVKLSLVAALAVGSMSVLEAKPLEEAIKNVDVSGVLRYRFDPASWTHDASRTSNFGGYNADSNKPHRFRAFLTTKLDAGDGFKVVGQLMYNNDRNGGWARGADQGLTTTRDNIVLKQAYLQYDLQDAGLSVLFGKQQLGTIWTADFTGMAAKVLFTPTKGLTIAAFGVDSFEGNTNDGDAAAIDSYDAYNKNMYGAAVLANFAGLDAQVWGAYWDKVATLYAVNLKYTLGFGGGNNVGIKATYLGNSISGDIQDNIKRVNSFALTTKDALANGNLVDGRLFAKFAGLDVKVGGIFYGKKDGMTINTLEDISGPDLSIGREMFYTEGARLVEAIGRNTFGYVGLGYTLPANVRIGVQGVFGQNVIDTGATIPVSLLHSGKRTNVATLSEFKDTRYEAVGEISWAVNKSLSFETFYSYLGSSTKDAKLDANGNAEKLKEVKHTVRLQALYKF